MDYNYSLIEVAPIAQLDRALVFGTSGWEFESLWAHFRFNLGLTFTSCACLAHVLQAKLDF
jgi:hypothetical protein